MSYLQHSADYFHRYTNLIYICVERESNRSTSLPDVIGMCKKTKIWFTILPLMRVVHHHYSSGIDLQSDEEREIRGKRIREDKKERFFWWGGGWKLS